MPGGRTGVARVADSLGRRSGGSGVPEGIRILLRLAWGDDLIAEAAGQEAHTVADETVGIPGVGASRVILAEFVAAGWGGGEGVWGGGGAVRAPEGELDGVLAGGGGSRDVAGELEVGDLGGVPVGDAVKETLDLGSHKVLPVHQDVAGATELLRGDGGNDRWQGDILAAIVALKARVTDAGSI